MHTHDEPQTLLEECYEALKETDPHHKRGDTICGALGLLVLMVMLLIATGTVPLYDWPT
jgi:hypothetical protein